MIFFKNKILQLTILLALLGCAKQENTKLNDINIVNEENFSPDNKSVRLVTLENTQGMKVQITNYGARIVSIFCKDSDGNYEDVVLGFENLKGYQESAPYYGATIGRYANRIGSKQLTLDEKTFPLKLNKPNLMHHGGAKGFHQAIWNIEEKSPHKVVLKYTSPHLEEGFPGNLMVLLTYTLTEKNEVKINYNATTDETTVVNLTNHSFFNLSGAGNGTVENHIVTINATQYTPILASGLPTGEIAEVKETPLDFTTAKALKEVNQSDFEQVVLGNGLDHNFVISHKHQGDLTLAATITDPKSKRTMKVFTTQPGMQVYTANFLSGDDQGKNGKAYKKRESVCFETQHFPDSPNHDNFPSTVVTTDKPYQHTCIYQFGVSE